MKQGYFVAIEGPEGAGKTLQREFMVRFLRDAGLEVVVTREPGGTPMADRIREILLTPTDEPMYQNTELLLMFAARAQHLDAVIRPAIAEGKVVICDRFIDSTYAYQHYGRGVPRKTIDELVKMVVSETMPDMTFMFTVPVEIGLKRIAARGVMDRIELEGQAFFSRVHGGYRQQLELEPWRYTKIDANMEIEQVQAQLIPHLQTMINHMHSRARAIVAAT